MPRTPNIPVHPHGSTALTPGAAHADAVYLRDDYQCLAARTAWAVIHPCAGRLALHPAHPTADSPLLLRTLCTAHATAATIEGDFQAACARYGWSLPTYHVDPVAFGRMLPVRYPDGVYYLLDEWADRRPLVPFVARATRIQLGLIDRPNRWRPTPTPTV